MAESEIQNIRMRTAKNTELIIIYYSDYIMMCIQKCGEIKIKEDDIDDEDKQSEISV